MMYVLQVEDSNYHSIL